MKSEPMAARRFEVILPDELFDQLLAIAKQMGIGEVADAATLAVSDWVVGKRAALDDRDPDQKYFVNEALDELAKKNR